MFMLQLIYHLHLEIFIGDGLKTKKDKPCLKSCCTGDLLILLNYRDSSIDIVKLSTTRN